MAGLVPAIHVFAALEQVVDARVKPGHDAILWPYKLRRATLCARDSCGGEDMIRWNTMLALGAAGLLAAGCAAKKAEETTVAPAAEMRSVIVA